MTTRIVHFKQEPYDVYIGRTKSVEPGIGNPEARGYWGNPFPSGAGRTRGESIALYIEWLKQRPYLIEQAIELLTDKTLGCWCKPRACHGDILVKICEDNKITSENDFW